MSGLLHLGQTLGAFALVLGVLVFIHEMGHYLAARWRGVYVEAFSIGFGRAIWRRVDRLGTVWQISVFPLGGFVRMHGMASPAADEATDLAAYRRGQAFFEKSILSRAIIVAAGPAANFLLAIVLYIGLYAIAGVEIPQPVVGEVVPGEAAALADLHTGDRILTLDGRAIADFDQLRHAVMAEPGRTVTLGVRRDTQLLSVPVHLGSDAGSAGPVGKLGITSGLSVLRKLPPGQAVAAGFQQCWDVTAMIVGRLGDVVMGRVARSELGGVISIAAMSGQAAALGLAALLSFMAVLSINLGLLNLLPVPVLDGGHLMFYLAEALRGKPLPARAQEYGYRVGIALVGGLMAFAAWNDLVNRGVFGWVARHISG